MAVLGSVAYDVTVSSMVAAGTVLCVAARLHPGRWAFVTARVLALVLVADAASWMAAQALQRSWSPATSLPLALCDMAVIVAAAACWWRSPLLVELTYFWGLAGTLQALLTPDLNVSFPRLVFFQYVVGHASIVVAAAFLVIGLGIAPRPGAVVRALGLTFAYTAFVGLVDAVTGGDYMFLRAPPSNWTLLSVLGPWPWYVLSAACVAAVLLCVLYAPFWLARRRSHPAGA